MEIFDLCMPFLTEIVNILAYSVKRNKYFY